MKFAQIKNSSFSDFKKKMDLRKRKYSTLCKYRKNLNQIINEYPEQQDNVVSNHSNKKKLRLVETEMKEIINEGMVNTRRKRGTGEREVVECEYLDTIQNRKKERVGKKYTKTRFKNAEFVDVKRQKMRKRKRKNKVTRGKNRWIVAVTEAKKQLKSPNFVIVRKEVTDKNDKSQKMGVAVYNLAKKIMEENKLKENPVQEVQSSSAAENENEKQNDNNIDINIEV